MILCFLFDTITEEGLKKAKQVTAALYDGDFAALSALTQFEMKSIFAGAKIHEMLYESGMTILDVVLKAKIYKHDRKYPFSVVLQNLDVPFLLNGIFMIFFCG